MSAHLPRFARRAAGLACATLWLLALAGCSVQAYQRGRLADPIMSFETGSDKAARRTKAFDAREGSTGGNGGAGGGCACK